MHLLWLKYVYMYTCIYITLASLMYLTCWVIRLNIVIMLVECKTLVGNSCVEMKCFITKRFVITLSQIILALLTSFYCPYARNIRRVPF